MKFSWKRYIGRGGIAKIAAGGFLLVVLSGILAVVGVVAYVSKDLPSPDRVLRREGFATKIYDRRGKLLYDVYSGERRTLVGLGEMPLFLRQATIAIEDKNFYNHQGFDPWGMVRAVVKTVVYRRLEGGSTLTQQLVKNTLLTPTRTLSRKIKEFILTLQVERKYSKDQILQMYLNEAPYGGTAWGVEAATEMYFGKQVAEVTLAEAAILAGLPQSPTAYSPYEGRAYVGRAGEVLRRMREDGYITRDQESEAREEVEKAQVATQSGFLKAPHFVFYVRGQLVERYGERVVEQGGLRVTTSLDLDLQEVVQKTVKEEIDRVKHLKIGNGAVVVQDVSSGEILAMVGSKGWDDPNYDGKYNVTLALRQPGSAIKPLVYLGALRKGYTAATLLMDTKTSFPGGDKPEYIPENYDGKYHGPLLVRSALGNSINVAAVKMISMVGIQEVLSLGYDMGLSTLNPTPELLRRVGLSVALGGGEVRLLDLTTAYSAFANGGRKVDPVSILKVTDNEGRVLEEWKGAAEKQVISAGESFIISSILADPSARSITFGPRSAINIEGKTVAVKTGTTNDRRDNWTVGWTPRGVVAGVWVGNNDNSPMREVASGVTGAAPIWRRVLLAAMANRAFEPLVKPEGIVEMDIDKISGYPAHDGFGSVKEYFIKGTEPAGPDLVHKKIKVCKGEGKLATPADIGSGNYDEKEVFSFQESDPFMAGDKSNKWQEGIDAWLKEQNDPKYHPPVEYCGNNNPLWITILEPGDKKRIDNNEVKIKVDVSDPNQITWVEFYVDGVLKQSLNSGPWEVTTTVANGSYHKIDIKARDDRGNEGSRYVEFSVNADYQSPTPAP